VEQIKTDVQVIKLMEKIIVRRKNIKGGCKLDEHAKFESCKTPNVREWLKET
jgi:hypothetical protein